MRKSVIVFAAAGLMFAAGCSAQTSMSAPVPEKSAAGNAVGITYVVILQNNTRDEKIFCLFRSPDDQTALPIEAAMTRPGGRTTTQITPPSAGQNLEYAYMNGLMVPQLTFHPAQVVPYDGRRADFGGDGLSLKDRSNSPQIKISQDVPRDSYTVALTQDGGEVVVAMATAVPGTTFAPLDNDIPIMVGVVERTADCEPRVSASPKRMKLTNPVNVSNMRPTVILTLSAGGSWSESQPPTDE